MDWMLTSMALPYAVSNLNSSLSNGRGPVGNEPRFLYAEFFELQAYPKPRHAAACRKCIAAFEATGPTG
jgi:hypothetical protein